MSSEGVKADIAALVGQVVVLDLASPYVCIGKLTEVRSMHLVLKDADLHDFRDNPATRENYVYDSVRLGIRRNRKEVLVRIAEIVAITRFADISEV
jgi:hypothetical protein